MRRHDEFAARFAEIFERRPAKRQALAAVGTVEKLVEYGEYVGHGFEFIGHRLDPEKFRIKVAHAGLDGVGDPDVGQYDERREFHGFGAHRGAYLR